MRPVLLFLTLSNCFGAARAAADANWLWAALSLAAALVLAWQYNRLEMK